MYSVFERLCCFGIMYMYMYMSLTSCRIFPWVNIHACVYAAFILHVRKVHVHVYIHDIVHVHSLMLCTLCTSVNTTIGS